LPPDARFDRLSTQSKHFIDIIKMIAYRAETAMAQILRQNMTRHDDARSLLRAIYSTEVDIVPDPQASEFRVNEHDYYSENVRSSRVSRFSRLWDFQIGLWDFQIIFKRAVAANTSVQASNLDQLQYHLEVPCLEVP
jgi:hypothetical protein